MQITLITACYNSASVIRTALESVLRQTWPELEYLVIDGGSTDGTVEIIREYEPKFDGKLRWVSEKDRGMYDAINKGIRMATGEVVGILNADDVLSDDRVIERVAEAFGSGSVGNGQPATGNGEDSRQDAKAQSAIEPGNQREARWNPEPREPLNPGTLEPTPQARLNPETLGPLNLVTLEPVNHIDVIFGDIRFVAARRGVGLDELRAEPTLRHYSARHWRPWMLQWGFMPPHPSVYIRRACFERLGDYALDYRIAADYALLIRFLRKARLRSRYLPMCFVDMRVGGMSTRNWRSNLLLNQEIVRGNREAGYFCCLPMLVPKYAFKVWEFVVPRVEKFKRG
ncbi:MAG TPA: glycosyltransferase family 2 protein [Kiritimatiellia bacterium]|nr:glycosyltransferase family 2 protein [Kiritimatiellia bacterium]